VNSVRRVKKRQNGDVYRKCGDGSYEIALAAPDCNLYLALASLLQTPPAPKPEKDAPEVEEGTTTSAESEKTKEEPEKSDKDENAKGEDEDPF